MPAPSNDKLLWEEVLLGNHHSFSTLFDRYWEPLFQYAYRILQNREDTEEIVQELFIHVWNKRNELPSLLSPRAYLFTILKNRLLNHLSRKKPAIIGLETLRETTVTAAGEEQLERKSADHLILNMAAALPTKMQQVYILHQFKGLSIAEIAHATGHSEQTIRNQFNTALKKLSIAYRRNFCGLVGWPIIFLGIGWLHCS